MGKKILLFVFSFFVLVTSCRSNEISMHENQSVSLNPIEGCTETVSPSLTPTIYSPTEIAFTPTFTPFPPYQNKEILFQYYVSGNHADFDIFFEPHTDNILTQIVIYTDGLQIINDGGEYYHQKSMSDDEIHAFFSELEALGFFAIESNHEHDPTDMLYDYGSQYQPSSDGLWDCIYVNANLKKTLCIYESDKEYLIQKMKDILKYLDNFEPSGTAMYTPDRLLLTVYEIEPASQADSIQTIPWREEFPSLEFTVPNQYEYDDPGSVIYISGDLAEEIYTFFDGMNGYGRFTQNGKEYIVDMRVVLPHEKVINAYQ